MRNVGKRSMILFIIGVLICIPFWSETLAKDGSAGDGLGAGRMTFDALVVRPIGILGTAFGAAIYIVSLPFSAMGGNSKAAYKKLVVDPIEFTFKRPLGEF